MSLDAVFREVERWLEDEPLLRESSNKNIGDKLAEEVEEYRDDPCVEEAADVFIAWVGSVGKCGFTLSEIVEAAWSKMLVNRARVWERMPDGTIHHVRQEGTDEEHRSDPNEAAPRPAGTSGVGAS